MQPSTWEVLMKRFLSQFFGNYSFKPVPSVRNLSLAVCVFFRPETLSRILSVNVHMPKDRISLTHQGYGFVEFLSEEDADYAIRIMNMIKLYGKPIRVNKVSS